jgi:hypothetical protein
MASSYSPSYHLLQTLHYAAQSSLEGLTSFEPNLWNLDGMQSCVYPRADAPAYNVRGKYEYISVVASLRETSTGPLSCFLFHAPEFPLFTSSRTAGITSGPWRQLCADSTYRC